MKWIDRFSSDELQKKSGMSWKFMETIENKNIDWFIFRLRQNKTASGNIIKSAKHMQNNRYSGLPKLFTAFKFVKIKFNIN